MILAIPSFAPGQTDNSDDLLYFSYGSNMSTLRLQARIPSAVPLYTAVLKRHRLKWHKQGSDGSAKCDCCYTGIPNHRVIGVVYVIASSQKPILDQYEGLGEGYEGRQVWVEKADRTKSYVATYHAIRINPSLRPFHWYKEHVLQGAREHQLPTDYRREIEAVPSIPDPVPGRHARELAIYSPITGEDYSP
ncbi:MAG: gamma-glutamylcyclotransferase [Gammaproteobacteria bacterium]|nr:gamma-glutamylcyclotransferase [Gammaproteobacteria bacterium]